MIIGGTDCRILIQSRIRRMEELRVFASRFQCLVNVGAEVLLTDPRGEARFVHYFFRLFIYMGEDDTDASPFAFVQKLRQ